MAGTNDFLPFGIAVGANVLSQAAYAALPAVATGFSAGIANSPELNKAWRQSSVMAAVIARFIIAQVPADNVLDNGDVDTIVNQLTAAIQQSSTTKPARIVTTSTALVPTLFDCAIGFNRTVSPAPTAVTLPNGAVVGQEFEFWDLLGNFNAYPITVTPPVGSIAGVSNWVLNEDKGGGAFKYFGSNIWGVRTW